VLLGKGLFRRTERWLRHKFQLYFNFNVGSGWSVGCLSLFIAACLVAGNSGFAVAVSVPVSFSFSVRSLCVLRPQSSRCDDDDGSDASTDSDLADDYVYDSDSDSADVLFFRSFEIP